MKCGKLWDVEGDSAEGVLTAVEAGRAPWGMLLWVPLMAGGDGEAVIGRWRQRALAVEERWRGGLGQVALIFAELAGRYAAWEKGWRDST